MPVSCVLADDAIMLVIQPGEHGSTFGGNPLAAVLSVTALEVVKDEKLAARSEHMGNIFRERIELMRPSLPLIKLVRGKGLLNAIVVNDTAESQTAWNLCLELMNHGLLAKPTHGNIIRLAPPLVITEEQIHECCDIIERVFSSYK